MRHKSLITGTLILGITIGVCSAFAGGHKQKPDDPDYAPTDSEILDEIKRAQVIDKDYLQATERESFFVPQNGELRVLKTEAGYLILKSH